MSKNYWEGCVICEINSAYEWKIVSRKLCYDTYNTKYHRIFPNLNKYSSKGIVCSISIRWRGGGQRVEWCNEIQVMMKQYNDYYSCFIDDTYFHICHPEEQKRRPYQQMY